MSLKELIRKIVTGGLTKEQQKHMCGDRVRAMSQIEEILKATQPETVFPFASKESIHSTFNKLVKQIHPDVCPGEEAKLAFIKLHELRDQALDRLYNGKWETPGTKMFKTKTSRDIQIYFRKKTNFELGVLYDGTFHQVFHIKKQYKDLFWRSEYNITHLPKYADAEMRKKMEDIVPDVVRAEALEDDSLIMSVTKPGNVLRLKDVVDYFHSIDPHHVAWMVSRVLNIACWFQYCDIAHYGLTVDNLYIHPTNHDVFVYGGWWYAHENGLTLKAVPQKVLDNTPKSLYEDKVATTEINQNLARMVGRELCGDVSGAHLLHDKNIPKPMKDFLIYPASDNAIDDYKRWREVLKESFGPRKFINFDITSEQLYYGRK